MTETVLLGDVPERNALRLGGERWALRHGEDVLAWGELATACGVAPTRSLRRASGRTISWSWRCPTATPCSS